MDSRSVLRGVQLSIGFLPLPVTIIGLASHKYFALVIALVLLVITVTLLPMFRKNANLWAFVFTAALSVPINIYAILLLSDLDLFFYETMFMNILMGILYYCVLFSTEEIIVGSLVGILKEEINRYEK